MEAVPSTTEEETLRIELPAFEGPLDLLLHLIRQHELDILELPVAFVTERYLEYLSLMRELNLDIASEYLVMAATLAHIKSKTLLPSPPPDQDDDPLEEALDPRQELIRRLLEYQKYKAAAEQLGRRPVAGRDIFMRLAPIASDGPAPLAETSVFALLDAFRRIFARAADKLALEVTPERITLQDRMSQVTEFLRERRQCQFDELFEGIASRYELVVTFLAILEMARLRLLRTYQAEQTAPLHLQYALLDESSGGELEPELSDEDGVQAAEPRGAEAVASEESVTDMARAMDAPDSIPPPHSEAKAEGAEHSQGAENGA